MSSHVKGPSNGNWAVFAEKVVEERDNLKHELSLVRRERDEARAEVAHLKEVIGDLREVVKDMRVLRAAVEGADGFRVHLVESEWDLLAASLGVKSCSI